MIGKTISHYQIMEKLGEGGMGVVYKAEDTKLKRRVALKFLPLQMTADPEAKERFEREAQAAAALNHPNIVTIHEIGEHEGQVFIAMEYVEGRTLKELISVGAEPRVCPDFIDIQKKGEHRGSPLPIASRPLSLAQVIEIATQLASGLAAAHEKGIVHRDIKPQNILVDKGDRVKILDFGLAKLKGISSLTKESSTLGTVHYMSPEQTMGKDVDQRSDIWSLGVVLYEMITGRLPFRGDYEQAVIYSILNEEPEPLTGLRPDVPSELQAMIGKCLDREIDVRYQHADDLIADLKRAKRDSKPVTVPTRERGLPGRSRKVLWPIAAAVVVLIFAVAFLVLKPFKAKEPASEVNLLPDRYYVAILENQTGDPSLDSLGRMAADWITQGLSQLGREIEPLVAQVAAAASQVQKTAEKGRAGKFICGAYYLSGDSLQIQVRIMDTTSGKVVYALPLVSGPRQDPMKAINILSQRLTGSLAMKHEWEMDPSLLIQPPLYEAYQEYIAGVGFFGSNDEEAIAHFKKAAQLDPQFFRPKLYIALSYSNRGDYAEADAILKQILGQKNQFSLFERHTLDWYTAHLQGNILKAYRAIRLGANLAPQSWVFSYLTGLYAQSRNHPQETVNTFFRNSAGKDFPQLKTSQSWWYKVLADSHHMLSNFDEELEVSREGKRLFPDNIDYHFIDARALAARGNVEGARKKIEECFAFPVSRLHMSQGLLNCSLELRVHGHADKGREIARQATAWLRQKENEKALTGEESFNLARIMAAAEQWDDAEKLASSLASKDQKNVGYAGLLGALHARRGDGAAARKISEKLQGCKQPYLFGEHTLWRARIAAQLGEKEEAVRLLREAFAQGNAFGVWLHRDIHLEPLRGFPAFEAFQKPQSSSVEDK